MTLTDMPSHVISFRSTGSGIDLSNVSYLECLCAECRSCGYIMQFRLDILLK